MSRIRGLKPEFFTDPDIGELSFGARLLFQGLWLQADREGRLEYDPRHLKVSIFPYDNVDIETLIAELRAKGMICQYTGQEPCTNGASTVYARKKLGYIWVRNFLRHQTPHVYEKASLLPQCPDEHGVRTVQAPCTHHSDPSDLDQDQDLDRDQSQTATPTPNAPQPFVPPKPRTIFKPRRKDAAWEGPQVYVPQRTHQDFVDLRHGNEEELLQWYPVVALEWSEGIHKDDNPGSDMIRFWKTRYDERWPPKEIKPTRSSGGPIVPSAAETRKKYLNP